jgi:hypothetical protein
MQYAYIFRYLISVTNSSHSVVVLSRIHHKGLRFVFCLHAKTSPKCPGARTFNESAENQSQAPMQAQMVLSRAPPRRLLNSPIGAEGRERSLLRRPTYLESKDEGKSSMLGTRLNAKVCSMMRRKSCVQEVSQEIEVKPRLAKS